MRHPHAHSAFSLVELSIVLVILGLLVGGILAGQSLIRAAELRAISTEHQRYITAVRAFRDRYFAIPGDMRNAASVWTTSTNGNGDGIVNWGAAANATGETFQFWAQLALAGLIEGNYTGLAGAGGIYDSQPSGTSQNIPASRFPRGAWGVQYLGNYVGDGIYFAANYGNFLLFGGRQTAAGPDAYILSPPEAWNIDAKIDDGKPGTGGLIGLNWGGCANAAASATDYSKDYNLTRSDALCAFAFLRQF